MNREHAFKPGDIIVSDRGLYQHYGIYAGDGRVIHYASKDGDFGPDVRVRETNLKRFSGEGKRLPAPFAVNGVGAECFPPEETVARARSRLGENRYNLVFNNCEHFARWCKYGESKSVQVEKAVATAALVVGTVVVIGSILNDGEET